MKLFMYLPLKSSQNQITDNKKPKPHYTVWKGIFSDLLHFMRVFPQFKDKFIVDFRQNMICIQEISYILLYCDVEQEYLIMFPAKTLEYSCSFVLVLLWTGLPQTAGKKYH